MSGPYAYFDSGARFDEGFRYAPAGVVPSTTKSKMSTLALNISQLTIPQKIQKGNSYVQMGSDNSNVPGNGPAIAVLSTAVADLTTSNAAYEDARQTAKQLLAARNAALENFTAAATALGVFTESATGGDAEKILSAGFDIKSDPVPPQPVEQILNVKVSYTGTPGYSEVRWKRDVAADAYVVECCQDPITPEGWMGSGTVVETKFTGNGAIPGKACWYRVAGLNRIGQGPWSEPALRPVM